MLKSCRKTPNCRFQIFKTIIFKPDQRVISLIRQTDSQIFLAGRAGIIGGAAGEQRWNQANRGPGVGINHRQPLTNSMETLQKQQTISKT